MKKRYWTILMSSAGSLATHQVNDHFKKTGKKHLHPALAGMVGALVSTVVADRLLPEAEPVTVQEYYRQAAKKNAL